jgi:hypothetical protein
MTSRSTGDPAANAYARSAATSQKRSNKMHFLLSHLPAVAQYRKYVSVSTLVLGVLLAGCAPDSVRSVDATGFNGFIRKIAAVCHPLQIGDKDIGEMLRLEGGSSNDGGYDNFLDATSKLYYNRISPTVYRQSLTGFFGAGTSNDASFACILNNLPAQRPNAPY